MIHSAGGATGPLFISLCLSASTLHRLNPERYTKRVWHKEIESETPDSSRIPLFEMYVCGQSLIPSGFRTRGCLFMSEKLASRRSCVSSAIDATAYFSRN